METTNHYLLTTINGIPFLLPYGQAVATFSRGLRLNEAGALVVESLEHEDPFAWYAKKTGLQPSEAEIARNDYEDFLKLLEAQGCLTKKSPDFPKANEPLYGTLAIGPLTVRLKGKKHFFSNAFTPFLIGITPEHTEAPESSAAIFAEGQADTYTGRASFQETRKDTNTAAAAFSEDQTITVTQAFLPDITGSTLLIRTDTLEVFAHEASFFLRFPSMRNVRLAALSRDGSQACYYVTDPGDEKNREALREDLFHAIRHSFLYMAQQKGFFALHSATILYRGLVFAFSGPSGTGKSTHANLWKKEFDVPLVNGDLSLLSLADGGSVLFHGMPWCGTSGITTKKTLPLGGVVFLKQAPENRLEPMTPERKILRLHNRLISPVWTPKLLKANLDFSSKAAARIGTWRYHCTKEVEAAHIMKAAVDQYLDD